MGITVEVIGAQKAGDILTLGLARASRKVSVSLLHEGHMIAASAEQFAPELTGKLRGSGKVERRSDAANTEVVRISFQALSPRGFDYAVPQHERLDYAHDVGGPKYLTKAVNARIKHLRTRLEKAVQDAFASK